MKYPAVESSTLEFKQEIPKNEQIIKTIIGFCNQNGGKLIIGVQDDGTIVGVDEDKIHQLQEYLEHAILEASFPPILSHIYTQRITDKTLLIVEVSAGMNKPYYLKKDGKDKGVYIRLGRSTLRANDNIIEELKLDSRGIPFDSTPMYQAKEDDLDLEKIRKFIASRKSAETGKSSEPSLNEAMLSYRIIAKEHERYYPTVCGILLFGKNPQHFFPEARIMCNHFFGNEMSKEVVTSKECLGTLDEQLHTAYNFVLNSLYKSWKIIGVLREEQWEIPVQAVRELVMNAIIHRNYHIPGPNKIAIFDNRIEIFSQGSFPGPMGQNLKAGFTYIRNVGICKILREMGLIESFGIGFITTFSEYEKAGLRAPDIIEGENFIKCILPRRTADNVLVAPGTDAIPNDLRSIIDLFLTTTEITVSDVIQMFHLSRPTATRKLSKLIELGLIQKIGRGRGVRYIK